MKTVFYRAAVHINARKRQGLPLCCCPALCDEGADYAGHALRFFSAYFRPTDFDVDGVWWPRLDTWQFDFESRILALLLADILWREAHPVKSKKRQRRRSRRGVMQGLAGNHSI